MPIYTRPRRWRPNAAHAVRTWCGPTVVPLRSTHPMHARWPVWTIGYIAERPAAWTEEHTVTAETLGGLDRILHAEPCPATWAAA